MTVDLYIFNMQRQCAIFNESNSINWFDVYAYDDSCADVLVEDDICSEIISFSPDSFYSSSFITHAPGPTLELKHLLDSLSMCFWILIRLFS